MDTRTHTSASADSGTAPLVGASGVVDVRVDHDRARRCGFPEVIFAQGKTPEQVARIAGELYEHSGLVLATRITPEQATAVRAALSEAEAETAAAAVVTYHELARVLVARAAAEDTADTLSTPIAPTGHIVVASAGTADLPVAEEAALTAETHGAQVTRLYDIGVAGVHRALAHTDTLRNARAIIAVAGMEGALPTLIAGLVEVPVIAVPTSVGYGANLAGIAPLLTMLNSCAGGIGVVNIDNGFGAAVLACRINNPTWANREAYQEGEHIAGE